PPLGGSRQGSVLVGTPTAALLSRPSDGAINSFQASSGEPQVAPAPTLGRIFTCQTVCQRAVVSTPTAFSTSAASPSNVTSRPEQSRWPICGPPTAGAGAATLTL